MHQGLKYIFIYRVSRVSGIRLYIYIQDVSCISDYIIYLYTGCLVYQGLDYIFIYRVSRASWIRLYIYIQGVSCIRDYTIYVYTGTVSLCVHVYVYPCYLINQINQNLNPTSLLQISCNDDCIQTYLF